MKNRWVVAGAVFGFLSVAAGALGAHGLEQAVPGWYGEERAVKLLEVFETGVRYALAHALALLALGALEGAGRLAPLAASLAGWGFCSGIVLFSGSLALLTLSNVSALGMITPFGGLAFLAGWAALGVAAARGGENEAQS